MSLEDIFVGSCFFFIAAVLVYAVLTEKRDCTPATSPLQHHCRWIVRSAVDERSKLHAILALEQSQKGATVWRVDWACSCFASLCVGTIAALSAPLPIGCVLTIVIATFLASMVALRCKHSFLDAHIFCHTVDARTRLVQRLLELPDHSAFYYGVTGDLLLMDVPKEEG